MKTILVTNDDGVNAEGIRRLCQALEGKAHLIVCAPEGEQSAVGLSITTRAPLRIEKYFWNGIDRAYTVNGTPADCVKLALSVILDEMPDLIVSGINRGSNAGRNVLYSGTVGGVVEGCLRGIPGIAFSYADHTWPEAHLFDHYVPQVVDHVFEHPLPDGTFLNVNFPEVDHAPVKGLKMARQGKRYWVEAPEERHHPEGTSYYWLGFKIKEFEEHPDSDVALLTSGYVTAVPVRVGELTDLEHFEKNRKIFENCLS